VTISFGYTLYYVCFNLYYGCFNLFCNVWVCVRVGFVVCGCDLVIRVLVFTVFCIVCTVSFVLFHLYIFILVCFACTSLRNTATE
jgi:hypothetical protein